MGAMKGSAVSQLSRRFKEAMEGDKALRGILGNIEKESLSNVDSAAKPPWSFRTKWVSVNGYLCLRTRLAVKGGAESRRMR